LPLGRDMARAVPPDGGRAGAGPAGALAGADAAQPRQQALGSVAPAAENVTSASPPARSFVPFHGRYLRILDDIERNLPVTDWKCGDVDVWPLARMDLHLDMQRQETGEPAPPPRALPVRALGCVARPAINRWRTRHDRAHRLVRPEPAHAIFLGDGVS